ncbi:MAG: class I mannose-6-phosphate isomerase [Thermoleophilia bacterium]|nr:class I mannose-6-phosphate isomerase [Thermoleophilia bacterium]
MYDRYPVHEVTSSGDDCRQGWRDAVAAIAGRAGLSSRCVVAVECYPGVYVDEVRNAFEAGLAPDVVVAAHEAFLPQEKLERRLAPYLGDDPVFGFMCPWGLEQFFAADRLEARRQRVASAAGVVLVYGTGASLVAPDADVLVYADLTRWEVQQRQRAHTIDNLGAGNARASARQLYKRAYFVDWRAADRQRLAIFDRIDFYLDTNVPDAPRLVAGDLYRRALEQTSRRPFRLVPFFDPGPWGGEWMRHRFGLPADTPNYAWCFDCVPEENSLLFGFGLNRIHSPALPLVHRHPDALLGRRVHETFGAEFPIRFDFLDTMGGGNLSLQVHPLRRYMTEKFGLSYTQDESYYLLDAKPGAVVYLGLKERPDPREFEEELRAAQDGGPPFAVERHVRAWPSRKHDHFSIPAGTIHCSGRDNVVLEISATPYIFTFKLWDWARLGLDGKPRPIHLEHGLANIQWDRTTEWVAKNLINPVREVATSNGVREETTGLHHSEFIETRRHWFTSPVAHDTRGTLNVLNLVEGETAVVESPDGAFEPLTVHYAETFVVPASVGRYRIRPVEPAAKPLATIKALVRGSEEDE